MEMKITITPEEAAGLIAALQGQKTETESLAKISQALRRVEQALVQFPRTIQVYSGHGGGVGFGVHTHISHGGAGDGSGLGHGCGGNGVTQ